MRDMHKIKKRIPSALVFLDMEIKKNIQSMYQKNVVKKNLLIYCYKEKKERDTMFLSKILILSCIKIILYIVEENIFVVIVYKLLVQKKY